MKPQELRIGNIIYFSLKSDNGRKSAGKVKLSEIEHLMHNDGVFNYEPIPLTEEILLKCGFKKGIGEFQHCKLGAIRLLPIHNRPYFLVKSISGDPISSINFLHQLQNLYFALTGEELTVNI